MIYQPNKLNEGRKHFHELSKVYRNSVPSTLYASPSPPHMESGNLELGEYHVLPPEEPTTVFVSCSIKNEPKDVNCSFPPHEDKITDILESKPFSFVKFEQMEEQMSADSPGTPSDSSSQDCLNTDDGKNVCEQTKSQHLDEPPNSGPFGVYPDYNISEVESSEELKTELKIENEGPATLGERYLVENSAIGGDFGQGYMHFDKHSHSRVDSSLSSTTILLGVLTETNIQSQCSEQSRSDGFVIKCDAAITNVDNKESNLSKYSACKNVFSCNECEKKFGSRYQLERHIRVHTGEKPFLCLTCNRSFARRSDLKTHSRIHTGEKPFVCSTCNRTFAWNYNLKRHLAFHNGEATCECSICNRTFANPGDLKKHSQYHLVEKPFVCSVCNKTFTTNSDLKKHSKKHTGEKPFLCSMCGKTFAWKCNFKNHLMTHTGEKPFLCSTCGRAFAKTCDFKRHLMNHTGEKPFLCSTCGKSFTKKCYFNKHLMTQTGVNNRKCHLRIHMRKKEFVPPVCK